MRSLPKALFVTYNGHGLGHITRMMAVAKQAQGRFTPMFLTLSEAFPLLRAHGFISEYMSSFEKLGMTKEEWEPLFASRLLNLLERCQPRVVVFDLVRPPAILADIRSASSGFELIWSRRGMWERRRNRISIHVGRRAFDSIVEPGDIAAAIDVGRTTDDREKVTAVSPIVLVSSDEQTERVEARRALGLPEHGRAVLVNVSDSEPEKLAALISLVRDVVTEAANGEEIHMFAPLHPLHQIVMPSVPGVMMLPVYPVARHLRAFDGVVSAAGYNSFHETVASGLPAVFVPRDSVSLDDQRRRALFTDLCGRAFFAESFSDEEFLQGVKRMLAPEEAEIAQKVTEELGAFTGGAEFAELVAKRCEALASDPYQVGFALGSPEADPEVLDRFPSGTGPAVSAPHPAELIVVVAVGRDDSAVDELASEIGRLQEETAAFRPVFLIDNRVEAQPLNTQGFQFETIMSPAEWSEVGIGPYEEYLESRVAELHFRLRADRVVTLNPGDSIDRSVLTR